MFSEIKQGSSELDTSLHFKRDFTYIRMIRNQPKSDDYPVHLKLHSKILQPRPSKNQYSHKNKSKPSTSTVSNKSRSLAMLKSQTQRKNAEQPKSLVKNNHALRRQCKTIDTKYKQQSAKCKINILQGNIYKKHHSKHENRYGNKLGQKNESIINCLKESIKSPIAKPIKRKKLNSIKSEIKVKKLGKLKMSDLHKSPKFGQNSSKIMQQYFGISEKQSSGCDTKKGQKQKKDKSKCRTDHSDNSSKTKKDVKFNKHKIKPQ